MAKKRFTDGLSNLFDNPFDAASPEAGGASKDGSGDEVQLELELDVPVKSELARKKLSSKGFARNLDNFLNESFEQESESETTSRRRSGRKRKSGLDFLIRSTVADQGDGTGTPRKAPPNTKRVTLIFRKDHLEALKTLAKERNIFLKDLVGEMVSNYLDE